MIYTMITRKIYLYPLCILSHCGYPFYFSLFRNFAISLFIGVLREKIFLITYPGICYIIP
jgi:hypothetical protein